MHSLPLVAQVVTEGIAKAASVATDTVGKVASMVSGMFSGVSDAHQRLHASLFSASPPLRLVHY